MDSKIEYIIKNFEYYELDDTQKELIVDWAENSDEFEALQNTLLATDQFVQSQESELNPTIKQRLDVRFNEKHNQKRLVWYNKLWVFLWPNDSPFYKRPLIQFAAICLIVAITIPFFPDISQPQLAMNDKKQEEKLNDEEKVSTSQKEESVVEGKNAEDLDLTEIKEKPEVESNLEDGENEASSPNEQMPVSENQEGWRLNEENTMADVESRSERERNESLDDSKEVLKEDSYYSGTADTDAPALDELSMNRKAKDLETPKKVDTKETLDLLTALY